MTALSDAHMEIKVTDPDRGKKPSSQASTATAKGTTKRSKKERHSPSSPSTTKQGQKSSVTGLQERGDEVTKPGSEAVGDTHKVNHTEPTWDVKSKDLVQGEMEPNSVASSLTQNKAGTMSKGEETARLLENGESKEVDGKVQKEDERKTGLEEKGSADVDSLEAATGPNLLVEEDGSVFVRVDKNYTETRPLDHVTEKQELKGSKFQFSNQLAFSLD